MSKFKTHREVRNELAKGACFKRSGYEIDTMAEMNFKDGWRKALEYAAQHMEAHIDGSDAKDNKLNKFLVAVAESLRKMQ